VHSRTNSSKSTHREKERLKDLTSRGTYSDAKITPNRTEELSASIKGRVEELAKLLTQEQARLKTVEANLAEYTKVEVEKEPK